MGSQNRKILIGLARVILFLTVITLTSCGYASNTASVINSELSAERTGVSNTDFLRPIKVVSPLLLNEQASIGVSLEFEKFAHQTVFLIITNQSGHNIKYGNGYDITGEQWGCAGEADSEFYDLPSGEQREIQTSVNGLEYGEFRITKDIITDPENSADTQPYKLSTEFAIENTTISADITEAKMEVDPDFADFTAPVAAMIKITNGFKSGRIYFDKSYWIQRNTGGIWDDVKVIGPDNFPDTTYSVGARQVLSLTEYWAWLYGELPPGEYRIGKSFLHRADDGKDTRFDLYAVFFLDGKPIPDSIQKDGSDWFNPFSGISTLSAKVTKLLDSNYNEVSLGNTGLLVTGLAPLWKFSKAGDPFYIWDCKTVAVLNANNEQINFSDIPQDAVVDITFSGPILASRPAIIGGAFLIKIKKGLSNTCNLAGR